MRGRLAAEATRAQQFAAELAVKLAGIPTVTATTDAVDDGQGGADVEPPTG